MNGRTYSEMGRTSPDAADQPHAPRTTTYRIMLIDGPSQARILKVAIGGFFLPNRCSDRASVAYRFKVSSQEVTIMEAPAKKFERFTWDTLADTRFYVQIAISAVLSAAIVLIALKFF